MHTTPIGIDIGKTTFRLVDLPIPVQNYSNLLQCNSNITALN